jgi:serine/threonine protein kinase
MTADKGYRYDDDVEIKLMELMNKLQKKGSEDKQDDLQLMPPKLLKPRNYASPYSKANMLQTPAKKPAVAPKKELESLPSLYLKLPEQELPKTKMYKIKWFQPDSKFRGVTIDLKIGGVLGKGSFATVYEATDLITNKQVAVKIFDKRMLKDKSKRQEVQDELDLVSRFNHPNIIKLLRVTEDLDKLYIVTECWGKFTLDEYAHKGLLEKKLLKSVFSQLWDAIKYLHSHNVFHRDIKLSNIMIRDGVICLLDFGLAASSNYVKEYLYCGTPTYMAPEILLKQGYEGAPVDVWSFGVCVYRAMTSKYPFGGRLCEPRLQRPLPQEQHHLGQAHRGAARRQDAARLLPQDFPHQPLAPHESVRSSSSLPQIMQHPFWETLVY